MIIVIQSFSSSPKGAHNICEVIKMARCKRAITEGEREFLCPPDGYKKSVDYPFLSSLVHLMVTGLQTKTGIQEKQKGRIRFSGREDGRASI